MASRQRKLWPQFNGEKMADTEYVRRLLRQLGLPERLAEHTTLTAFSDCSLHVKIDFNLSADEVVCSYKLGKKFGA